MNSADKVTILICGGGNAAHAYAGVASSKPNTEARVLTLYADEAKRWSKHIETGDFVVNLNHEGKSVGKTTSKPSIVTKDPAKAVVGADIIAVVVPAFAHAQYFEAMKPYIQPGTIIAGLPGQAGFEFVAHGILGNKAKQCTLINFESLPWACRMLEFGKEAEVIGTKEGLVGAIQVGSPAPRRDPVEMLQQTLGEHPVLKTSGHLLGMTLMAVNGVVHPSILYGRWHDWDGKPVEKPPLFYHGIDEFAAQVLSDVSDEVMAIAGSIMKQRPEVDLTNVIHIKDWYMRCYAKDITDKSSLKRAIETNRAYVGLTHPTVQTDDGKYMPDFNSRYFTEDIPFGLLVMMGVGEVAGVDMPNMRKITEWTEQYSNKKYLVDGKVKGPDVARSRCPQSFNLVTLTEILGG